ncbi:MAG: hypothetical protein ACJ768_02665 [Gaiellaceae bacterium]
MTTPVFTHDRPLTEDEQSLVTHISMWGSDGYPVRKLGRGWWWEYRETVKAPQIYKTKRAAVAAFETFLEVLHCCLRAAAYRRAMVEAVDRNAERRRALADFDELRSLRELEEEAR